MKVLFAVSTENIVDSIIKVYQKEYKEIISSKNVYYFNAIIKELQRNQGYDRIVISEELEPFTNNNYDAIDKFLFEKLDNISDEAIDSEGRDIPIIVICSERREKSDNLLVKLFSMGVYDALVGKDRKIEDVCRLLNKPRTKKEAKAYYKIEQGEYEHENENNVSEVEIRNILSHFKKISKNEDKYVESFNSIAEQYNDEQLRIITKFLPIEVKAVLEARSPKYQSIMMYRVGAVNKDKTTNQKIETSNIKVAKILDRSTKKMNGPIVIPSTIKKTQVKKIKITDDEEDNDEEVKIEEENNIEVKPVEELRTIEPEVEEIIETEQEKPKRGRGRPRKNPPPDTTKPKRGRGRPRKNPLPDEDLYDDEEDEKEQLSNEITELEDETEKLPDFEEYDNKEDEDKLPGFDEEDDEEEDENELPGFEDEDEEDEDENELPDFEDEDDDEDENELPGFEDEDDDEDENELPGFEDEEDDEDENELPGFEEDDDKDKNDIDNFNAKRIKPQGKQLLETDDREDEKIVNISHLLSQDKKIVAFVGTSKNGVSFLANNMSYILSERGINTALVDLTKNKNSFYIYTQDNENIREIAYNSMEALKNGEANGIRVNKNLTVYTASPNIRNSNYSIENMLTTLIRNYSLVILDCDYTTSKEYFRAAQEIYLTQSMDVLTIQPLTEFLKRLKDKEILDETKLRAVINKAQKVKGLTENMIVGGMSTYNDPEMSFQNKLFDMKTIPTTIIPFDMNAYQSYLSQIVNCEISTKGYSRSFLAILNRLADQVYPLVYGNKNKNKNKIQQNQIDNNIRNNMDLSNMNETLNRMKKQYK